MQILQSSTVITGDHHLNVWVNRKMFYVVEFNKPYRIIRELPAVKDEKARRLILSFNLKPGEELLSKIGISTVGIEEQKRIYVRKMPVGILNR